MNAFAPDEAIALKLGTELGSTYFGPMWVYEDTLEPPTPEDSDYIFTVPDPDTGSGRALTLDRNAPALLADLTTILSDLDDLSRFQEDVRLLVQVLHSATGTFLNAFGGGDR